MTRQQAIAALADFAGPLGPFESLEELLKRKEEWIVTSGRELADALLDILIHPLDDNELRSATRENFEGELSEVLQLLGKRDPLPFLQTIGPYLTNPHARPTIIEVVGALGAQEGIDWLEPLLSDERLTSDELIRLACALGEIGGDRARALLEHMRHSYPGETEALQREIDVALQSSC